ncbi:MAG: nucleotidyltransferase domain-containing protein [Actinomycetota bacterium]
MAAEVMQERKSLRHFLADESLSTAEAVILVGSWARGLAPTPWSDIDVLVLGPVKPWLTSDPLQVAWMSGGELRRRVAGADDFAQWALRFGVCLKGRRCWEALRDELLPGAPWPDPERKLAHARSRMRTAQDLVEMGDLDAAQEELRFALAHLARAVLLSHGIFPLSRPEIPRQLQDVGDAELAHALADADPSRSMGKGSLRAALGLLGARLAGWASRSA